MCRRGKRDNLGPAQRDQDRKIYVHAKEKLTILSV